MPVNEPMLANLCAAIGRHLDQPDYGYDLIVKVPVPNMWVAPAGQGSRPLVPGSIVRLRGAGNRFGFGRYVVELPPPMVPLARFTTGPPPDRADIAEVLGLSYNQLADPSITRSRYLNLVDRFSPDLNESELGHLSRLREVQACWDALNWDGD